MLICRLKLFRVCITSKLYKCSHGYKSIEGKEDYVFPFSSSACPHWKLPLLRSSWQVEERPLFLYRLFHRVRNAMHSVSIKTCFGTNSINRLWRSRTRIVCFFFTIFRFDYRAFLSNYLSDGIVCWTKEELISNFIVRVVLIVSMVCLKLVSTHMKKLSYDRF